MTQNITYRSKVELIILIPVLLILGTVMTIMIVNMIWIGMVICTAIALLTANIYFNTTYTITPGGLLIVKCGVLEKFEIEVSDIEWIRKTNELSNAPALAIDRIEVNYKNGRVLISPKDRKQFLSDLRVLNPKIWMAE